MSKQMLHYAPGDCALVIGPAGFLQNKLEMLRLAGLRPALLCSDPGDAAPQGLRALAGRLADVSGWMGAFHARLSGPDSALDLAPLSYHDDGHFDWVLDFSGAAAPGRGVAPLGYYALATDDFPALKRALLEIAGRLRAGHTKPRYFDFNADLCAHRRQGIEGCSACLDACAAGAITHVGDLVQIEPYLCQGCGGCALVCPSGAVRLVEPGAPALPDDCGEGLWIGPGAPAGWLALEEVEPARRGLEFWLTALAQGAGRVAIAAPNAPEVSRAALAGQLEIGRTLLAGLGLPTALGWANEALDPLPVSAPFMPPPGDDKRAQLFAALDHLTAQAPAKPVNLPLPAGAPLGEVDIGAACTLCAACVRICPSQALSLSGVLDQLAFTEARCLQCGLCRNVCPEKVIHLNPRLLLNRAARTSARIVAKAERVACAGCGQPYTSRAMLARTQTMMAGHPMFQGEQARLMTLCPDCRQRAMAGG